ncbi:MAG: hypothetical protein HYY07_01965, partial [Elusimicrobia bacterium]|nr:hypothetical protein [Elusimicrobiota bacterium]
ILRSIDREKADAAREVLRNADYEYPAKPIDLSSDPHYESWMEEAQWSQREEEDRIALKFAVPLEDYSPLEQEMVDLAFEIVGPIKIWSNIKDLDLLADGEPEEIEQPLEFQIQQVLLMAGSEESPVSLGIDQKGTPTLLLDRSLVQIMGKPESGSNSHDILTNHLLRLAAQIMEKGMEFDEEEKFRSDNAHERLWQRGVFFRISKLTDDSKGKHAEAEAYIAGVSVMDHQRKFEENGSGGRRMNLYANPLPLFFAVAFPLILSQFVSLPASLYAVLAILSLAVPHGINLWIEKKYSLADIETKKIRAKIQRMDEVSKSPHYANFSQATVTVLSQKTNLSQDRVILVHIRDLLRKGNTKGENEMPADLEPAIQGVVKGIEKYQAGHPTQNFYLKFTGGAEQDEKMVRDLIEEMEIQKYVLKDFYSRDPLEALKEVQGFSVAFVLTLFPEEWPSDLTLISFLDILKKAKPRLQTILDLWKTTSTFGSQA